MVVIANFTLPPEEFVLGASIDAVPDVEIALTGVVASLDALLTPYVDVRDDPQDLDRFERALADEPTAADAVTLAVADGERSYRVQRTRVRRWRNGSRTNRSPSPDERSAVVSSPVVGDEVVVSAIAHRRRTP